MLTLHVLQAQFGDCLVLEFGTDAEPHFILVDGGPPLTYERVLGPSLKEFAQRSRTFDAVILSHVDNDHIIGLLDLFADLRQEEANGQPTTIQIRELWHNSFSRTVDRSGHLQQRLKSLLATAGATQQMQLMSESTKGIGEGNSLRLAALAMPVPINPGFPDDLITVETGGIRTFENLTLRIVGPTQQNLDELAAEWTAWLDTHEAAIRSGDPFAMANADRSIPNLSSIMVLVQADGRSILLTGDGRSDHLLDGLGRAGLLNNGSLHVDVLKLPHHGSNRNITKTFFRKVTADQYVASANGKDDNPDLATLIWLVETAHEQNRRAHIVATNRTLSTDKLQAEYPPAEFGYELRILAANERQFSIPL
jgi:hypothetical protein